MEVEPEVFSRILGANLKQYQVCESRLSVNKRKLECLSYKKPRVMNLVKIDLSDLHSDMQEARGRKGNLSDLLLCIILFLLTLYKHEE